MGLRESFGDQAELLSRKNLTPVFNAWDTLLPERVKNKKTGGKKKQNDQ